MHEKLFTLLERLSKETQDGRLKWQETADENAFRIGLGSGVVRIERHCGWDNESDVSYDYCEASIINGKGQLVEEASSQNHGRDGNLLYELHGLARYSALNVESILDEMLTSLNNHKVCILPDEQKKLF